MVRHGSQGGTEFGGGGTPVEELRHLGFLLEGPMRGAPGGARLLVALRSTPTHEHFDPERIRWWRTGDDRRGHPSELAVDAPAPLRTTFSWGRLAIVDRAGVENEFATLGGQLAVEAATPGMLVATFTSPGPILRLGGHSQEVDLEAAELGAFFGRIMVPIDFEPGVEEAISAATPLELYAAFIGFEAGRYHGHPALRRERPAVATMIGAEARRLAGREPEAWSAGQQLLGRMGMADAG